MLRVRADGPTMQTVRQCRREVRDGPTMQTGDVLMCMLVEMTGTAVRRRTMARRSRLYCRRLSGRAKRGYPPSRNPKPERNPAAKWAKPETQAPRKSETRNPNPGETPSGGEHTSTNIPRPPPTPQCSLPKIPGTFPPCPVLTTLRHPALGRFWIQDTPNVTKCNFASLGVAIAVTRLGLGNDGAPVQTEK